VTHPSPDGRLLVVGGGIGGMAAAVSLRQRGFEVLVIEKRPAFDIPGVGLGQPANALRVYDRLGVLDDVLDVGFSYDRMRYLDWEADLLVEHLFLMGGDGVPPFSALPRSDLHRILRAAAERAGVETRLGCEVSELVQTPDGVDVGFSDGRQERVSVVVGFDGIRSATRRLAFGDAFEPADSRYGAWRIQVPRPAAVDAMEFYQGIGGKTGAIPLRGDLMYLFHIGRAAREADGGHASTVRELMARLDGYSGYIGEVRDSLAVDSDVVYSRLEPSLLPPPWHRGRVVLGGDAAHTVPPHLTQGAALAVEDGWVLADELARDQPIGEALANYSERRFARCAFVLAFGTQMLEVEQAVSTADELEAARKDIIRHASTRLGSADRVMDASIERGARPWR
jgi:2-polyprenyl-6-methoxyphenol hydroxylase-like FAD-dependent oxidoreductase